MGCSFQETTIIKRTLVAFVPEIQHHAGIQLLATGGRHIFTFSLHHLFVNFLFCTQVPSPFPNHRVNWSRPTCILESPYKCSMSLAAAACVGSQHEPPHVHCGLQFPSGKWESSHNSLFCSVQDFCSICNVAIILRELGEILRFLLQEIIKYLLGHREKANVLWKWTQDALGQKKKRRSLNSKDVYPMQAYSKVYKTLKQSWEQLLFSCLLGDCPDNKAVVWKVGPPPPLAMF